MNRIALGHIGQMAQIVERSKISRIAQIGAFALWLWTEYSFYKSENQLRQSIIESIHQQEQESLDLLFNPGHMSQLQTNPHPFPFNELLEFIDKLDKKQVELLMCRQLGHTSDSAVQTVNWSTFHDQMYRLISLNCTVDNSDQIHQYIGNQLIPRLKDKAQYIDCKTNQVPTIRTSRSIQCYHTPWFAHRLSILWNQLCALIVRHVYKFEFVKVQSPGSNRFNYILHRKTKHFINNKTVNQKTSRLPVIYFPGIGGSLTVCYTLMRQLQNASDVIIPLFPACCREGSMDMSLFEFNHNLKRYLDQQHITSAHMIGWSFGGLLTSRFVSQFPLFQVAQLVLIEPCLFVFSASAGFDWFRSSFLQTWRNLVQTAQGARWSHLPMLLIMACILHNFTSSIAALAISPYRCVWNIDDWDKPNVHFLLSENDPLTKQEYEYILQHFKHAHITVEPGTHGSFFCKFNKVVDCIHQSS